MGTPEVLKAINARTVQQTTHKKPTPPAPIHSGKRPSSDNLMDPTQRKKFAPSRLCPSMKTTTEVEENNVQSVSSSKEVKTQGKVTNKDREKSNSEKFEKNE